MYIYFGTRSIIVRSENVTIQHTKYIAEDSIEIYRTIVCIDVCKEFHEGIRGYEVISI